MRLGIGIGVILFCDRFHLSQWFVAIGFGKRGIGACLRTGEVCRRLADCGAIQALIDLEQRLARANVASFREETAFYQSINLRPDLARRISNDPAAQFCAHRYGLWLGDDIAHFGRPFLAPTAFTPA